MRSKEESPAIARAPGSGFLPDFCRVPTVLGVVLSAQLLAIVLTLAAPGALSAFWERLGPLSLHIQLIALSGAALLCMLRGYLARVDDRIAALVAWALLMALTGLTAWGASRLLPWGAGLVLPEDGLPGLMVRSLAICAIVAAVLLRYLYLHYLWRRQVEAEADASFQALQARIRPHFLFNSMNTIAGVVHREPRLAEELIEDLSDLFRAALKTGGTSATLAQELELVRRYLHLEEQRLGERLHVQWNVDELPGNAPLPPLTLQPLIENAVSHGVAPSRKPGLVRIDGRYRRGQVNLSIRNSLPDDHGGARPSAGHGIAMDNVRQRLAAMYPGSARLIESRIEGDYQVRLVFPYPWRVR
jgi:two-component system, LytTR family, sensor histidine kinase AlgZ